MQYACSCSYATVLVYLHSASDYIYVCVCSRLCFVKKDAQRRHRESRQCFCLIGGRSCRSARQNPCTWSILTTVPVETVHARTYVHVFMLCVCELTLGFPPVCVRWYPTEKTRWKTTHSMHTHTRTYSNCCVLWFHIFQRIDFYGLCGCLGKCSVNKRIQNTPLNRNKKSRTFYSLCALLNL